MLEVVIENDDSRQNFDDLKHFGEPVFVDSDRPDTKAREKNAREKHERKVREKSTREKCLPSLSSVTSSLDSALGSCGMTLTLLPFLCPRSLSSSESLSGPGFGQRIGPSP